MYYKTSVVLFLLHLSPLLSVLIEDVSLDVKTNVCNTSLTADGEASDGHRQVKCTCNDVSATCSNLGLTKLPALISFPHTFLRATFSGNHITNIEDDTFYSGREIIELDLSHNRIDFVSVIAFAAFKKLQRLYISHNRIFNLPTFSFKGLSHLRVLDLSFNDIKGLSYDSFQNITTLEELNLKGNPLHEVYHLSPLTNLQILNLDGVMLPEVPDHLFVHTTKLRVLSLANNQLTDVPSGALINLKQLKHLDLSGNPIPTIDSQAFLGLDMLQDLYLDRMPELRKIEAYAFGDLRRLRELHCSYNFQLNAIDKNAFVEKTSGDLIVIEQLFLRENNLHQLPPDLLRWTKDMELDLRGNPWDCSCQVQWMVYLKTKTDFQSHLKCVTPVSMHGQRLSKLKNVELPCGLSVLEIAFLSGLSLLAVTLCFGLIGFFLHRKKYRVSTDSYFKIFRKTGVDDIEYAKGFDL